MNRSRPPDHVSALDGDDLPQRGVERWQGRSPGLILMLLAEAVYIGGVLILSAIHGSSGLRAVWTWLPVPLLALFATPFILPEVKRVLTARRAIRIAHTASSSELPPGAGVDLTVSWAVPPGMPAVRRVRIMLVEILLQRTTEVHSVHRRHELTLPSAQSTGDHTFHVEAPFKRRLGTPRMRSIFVLMADLNVAGGRWWRVARSVRDDAPRHRPSARRRPFDPDLWPVLPLTGGSPGMVTAKEQFQWVRERAGDEDA